MYYNIFIIYICCIGISNRIIIHLYMLYYFILNFFSSTLNLRKKVCQSAIISQLKMNVRNREVI